MKVNQFFDSEKNTHGQTSEDIFEFDIFIYLRLHVTTKWCGKFFD